MSEELQKVTEGVRSVFEQKAVVDNLKERLAEENKKLTSLKMGMLETLDAGELEKYNVPGFGTVSRLRKFSIKVPKDPESKQALFDYISEKHGEDVLFNMTSINSQTLQSFYKDEKAIAVVEGNIDWNLPGVGEPKLYYDLGITKERKS